MNNRMVSKDTEQDVVLAPATYWRLFLQSKLEKLLGKKLAKNRPVKSEDTTVVVSVTERSQRDLTKRFDDTDIDWTIVERQLVVWGELFRAGKKLRLNLAFNYVETIDDRKLLVFSSRLVCGLVWAFHFTARQTIFCPRGRRVGVYRNPCPV